MTENASECAQRNYPLATKSPVSNQLGELWPCIVARHHDKM